MGGQLWDEGAAPARASRLCRPRREHPAPRGRCAAPQPQMSAPNQRSAEFRPTGRGQRCSELSTGGFSRRSLTHRPMKSPGIKPRQYFVPVGIRRQPSETRSHVPRGSLHSGRMPPPEVRGTLIYYGRERNRFENCLLRSHYLTSQTVGVTCREGGRTGGWR